MRKRIALTISAETLEATDRVRGDIPRSRFVDAALRKAVDAYEQPQRSATPLAVPHRFGPPGDPKAGVRPIPKGA